MKFGSICSGIEAASVAWNKLGWEASWFAEIEQFPSAVLAHHYPDVRNLGDMTQLPEMILNGDIDAPDILCGGTPCQAFSIAGNRQSLDDSRGNLTLTFCEIADALDTIRDIPAIIFWENVPGVLNTKDNAFGCFLARLAGEDSELQPSGKRWTNAGVVFGHKRTVAWRVLDAQYFGLAQRRKRVFVVASAREGFDPAEVLFEFEGLRRDFAPLRSKRKDTTRYAERGIADIYPTIGCELAKQVNNQMIGNAEAFFIPETFRLVSFGEYSDDGTASTMKSRDYKDATDLVTVYEAHPADSRIKDMGDVCQTVTSRWGTGGGDTPLVAQPESYGIQGNMIGRKPENGPQGCGYSEELSFTQTKADVHGVAYGFEPGIAKREGNPNRFVEEQSPTMRSQMGDNQIAVAHAFKIRSGCEGGGKGYLGQDNKAFTLSTHQDQQIFHQMAVRRLTPRECERLQGFPDDYTKIPYRNKDSDKCPDSPRYKALGNSWAVPVVRWIGERIAKQTQAV